MNILSLRTMQRSIDARREFLDIFGGKKDILVESFSLPTPTPDTHSAIPTPGSPNSRVSFALSEEEMHAPLLRTQQLGSNQVSDSIMSIADYDPTDLDPYSPSISNNTYWNYPRAASVLSEEKTQVEANTRNPEGAREPLYKHLSTWKKLVGNSSETVEAKPWCSWHEQGLLSSSEIHMKDPHSHHLYSSSTNTIALDDVPIATPTLSISTPYSENRMDLACSPPKSFQPLKSALRTRYTMHDASVLPVVTSSILRSESSISGFRPISKNLAPRCKTLECPFLYSRSSTTCSDDHSYKKSDPWAIEVKKPTITKSRSVPSTVSHLHQSKPSPPLPSASVSTKTSKERNFVMRSIVSKKASLSKLFTGKKTVS
ncbi:hypothetical protein BDF14DRAFT_1744546 [Spinellus fusiger]|nr:hypothetical protein BDF14DRAFT_1744546 [Spinellus fusiger]